MITYLYIIKNGMSGDSPVKIGVATNVEKRLLDLQTGNPTELIILYKIPMNSRSHAYSVESILHKKFKKQRIRGEWFIGSVINRMNLKELLKERIHEQIFDDDGLSMAAEANKYI